MPIKTFSFPKVTKALALILAASYVLGSFFDQYLKIPVFSWLWLTPDSVFNHVQLWRMMSYSLVHQELFQGLLNILLLLMLGMDLETRLGSGFFLAYIFFCSFFAAFVFLILSCFFPNIFAGEVLMGAGASLYGLLLAYGILFSDRTMLFMMLFPMQAKVFVLVLASVELLSTLFHGAGISPIGSMAHLSGLLGGFLALTAWARWKARHRAHGALGGGSGFGGKKIKKSHLKLVVNNKKIPPSSLTTPSDPKPLEEDFETSDDEVFGPEGPTYH